MWLLLATACAYKVTLTSQPSPVEVRLPDGSTVITPTEVVFRWAPFGHQRIVATSTGLRPLALDLRDREIRWWRLVGTTVWRPATIVSGRPRGEVHLVLIPEHGPSGTWAEDDVP